MKLLIKIACVIFLFVNLPFSKVYNENIVKSVPAMQFQKNDIKKGKSIYIYNTHQKEEYQSQSVKEGSRYLMKLLEAKGYEVDYELEDFELYKLKNNIDYSYSYTVSKKYLQNAIEKHGDYDLIIDYHRDSIPKNLSTLTLDGKSYAKLLFVVGKGSSQYKNVNASCHKLSEMLNEKIPGISKGIMTKQSDYNQGSAPMMMLIEVGAHENTYEEVKNTLKILAVTIDEYLSL